MINYYTCTLKQRFLFVISVFGERVVVEIHLPLNSYMMGSNLSLILSETADVCSIASGLFKF